MQNPDDLEGDWLFLDLPGNEPLYRAAAGTAELPDTSATPTTLRRFYRVQLLGR